MDMKSRMIYMRKLKDYMERYGIHYSKKAKAEIQKNFLDPSTPIIEASDIFNQIYEYIGVFEKEKPNTYDVFIDCMIERMDINRRLLEVGCGYYPSLAKRIASLQKYGSVTAIDPRVVTTEVEGIEVISGYFSTRLGLEQYDMFYGLYPCEATIEMITLANIFNKDLCILACDCCETPFGELDDMEEWLEYIDDLLKKSTPLGREFKIEHISSVDAPLITTRKLKN